MTRKRCVDETGGLLTINLLLKMAMEEGIGDIHLMNWPASGHRKLEDGADRARFDNRGKRLSEVNSSALSKTTNHPASLVALKCTIRAGLVAKNPLAGDDVRARRPGNQCPGTVPLKSVELFLHRRKPVRITEGCASGHGKRRRLCDGGGEEVLIARGPQARTVNACPSSCNRARRQHRSGRRGGWRSNRRGGR